MSDEHIQRIQEAVRSGSSLRPVGGGSKPALSAGGNLSLAGLAGVLEYEPSEYTFTALAGTSLLEVETLLREHGQYLPFDPPFAGAGATLGGTVAAGLSGPGRFRYGGVRDFLLGVTFVSGEGKLVTGGGKVVKNAAGFDFPKLMVGALGAFGVLVELTFKVFPRPEAYATLDVEMGSLEDAVNAVQKLAVSPFEPACLDFEPSGRVLVRIGGTAAALRERLGRIQALVGRNGEVLEDDADEAVWREAREFAWISENYNLVKIPLNPQRVGGLERALDPLHRTPPLQRGRQRAVAGVAGSGGGEKVEGAAKLSQPFGFGAYGNVGDAAFRSAKKCVYGEDSERARPGGKIRVGRGLCSIKFP